jgi:hypothetical protein
VSEDKLKGGKRKEKKRKKKKTFLQLNTEREREI